MNANQPEPVEIEGSTGIRGADDFIAEARGLGLSASATNITTPATLFSHGGVMLPEQLVVHVRITIPVPESVSTSALALFERANVLNVYWSLYQTPRHRGRWISGNHSMLGGHEDMHTLKRCRQSLGYMARNASALARFADEG